MRREYPSDISREQFKLIEAELKNTRKMTRPTKYDFYDIYSVQYSIWLKRTAHGGQYRTIFQSGEWCAIITIYWKNKMKLA